MKWIKHYVPPYSLKIFFGGFAIVGAASSVDSFTSWFSDQGTLLVCVIFILTFITFILNLFYQYYKLIKAKEELQKNINGLSEQANTDKTTIGDLRNDFQKNSAMLTYVLGQIPPENVNNVRNTMGLIADVKELENGKTNEDSKNN